MLIIDEILKQLRGIEYFKENKNVSLENGASTLFLECIGFGPLGGQSLRLVYRAQEEELEINFEKHSLCWLPYYFRDSKTESFLYEFVGAREPLNLDVGAGSYLIQRALFLELMLRAQGFDRLDDESLYHPLFTRRAS